MGKSNSGGEILIKSNPIGNAETKKHEIAAKSKVAFPFFSEPVEIFYN